MNERRDEETLTYRKEVEFKAHRNLNLMENQEGPTGSVQGVTPPK